MLIYQDMYKNTGATAHDNSHNRSLKRSTTTPKKLNLRNINFLRALGFKVKQKKLKNE